MRRLCSLAFLALAVLVLTAVPAAAKDLHINIPKRTKPTPVQQLNRDGVKALQKKHYEEAKRLFYKAYLLDPNDPFTLNNLGYISELEGELDRAQRYYGLAAELGSDATIDRATSDAVEGKRVAEVAGNAEDKGLVINRLNIEAMSLLLKDRAAEAEVVLGKALQLDLRNPFTLNNIGFMREQEGELESALSYYNAAANSRSDEKIIVAVNSDWRGKPISEIAARNAGKVRKLIEEQSGDSASVVARLNLRGVAAINRNDRQAAREYFEKAYKLDRTHAFTLNNMGYLSELDGDRETAQFYYGKAKEAEYAGQRVGMATRADLIGQPLRDVAEYGDQKVQARMEAILAQRRASGAPLALKRRDGSVVVEPPMPPRSAPRVDMPATDQPPADFLPPLPENKQPAGTQPPAQAQPLLGQPVQNVIPPLPDSQQPPESRTPQPQKPPDAQPQKPLEAQPVQDVIPPLPDSQQPPEVRKQPPSPQTKPPLP